MAMLPFVVTRNLVYIVPNMMLLLFDYNVAVICGMFAIFL